MKPMFVHMIFLKDAPYGAYLYATKKAAWEALLDSQSWSDCDRVNMYYPSKTKLIKEGFRIVKFELKEVSDD